MFLYCLHLGMKKPATNGHRVTIYDGFISCKFLNINRFSPPFSRVRILQNVILTDFVVISVSKSKKNLQKSLININGFVTFKIV